MRYIIFLIPLLVVGGACRIFLDKEKKDYNTILYIAIIITYIADRILIGPPFELGTGLVSEVLPIFLAVIVLNIFRVHHDSEVKESSNEDVKEK